MTRTPVNDSPTLTHEDVMAALGSPSTPPHVLRGMAAEARAARANALAEMLDRAADWRDGLELTPDPAPVATLATEALRAELARLNDERRDDERRAAICQELTLRMIARELPADWEVWHDDRTGWAVSRDHGATVVGVGYRTLAQAFDVARRTLQNG